MSTRPWSVSIGIEPIKTFGTRTTALGYAVDKMLDAKTGTHAIVRGFDQVVAIDRTVGFRVTMRTYYTKNG